MIAVVRRTKPRQRVNALPRARRRLVTGPAAILVLAVILLFPLAMGPFFAQVIATVALFILLGLGLNITLGLAGLLDLGFVAFYAVGAYTVALLTSPGEFGLAHALPGRNIQLDGRCGARRFHPPLGRLGSRPACSGFGLWQARQPPTL